MADEMNIIRHIVGNYVGFPMNYHKGNSPHLQSDDIHQMQEKVKGTLETALEGRENIDAGALAILDALKTYDCRDSESYTAFRTVFDDYTGALEAELREMVAQLRKEGAFRK
ncbi:MAG: hypothetical protein HZC29_01415 [Thaumarchaeota archaeon]|nr:hypothetical protein [Nitrososphaerota archaeon]